MAAADADTGKRIEEAQKLAPTEPAKAEKIYQQVLQQNPGSNEAAIKHYETALVSLGELYRDQKKVDALAELVKQARSVLSSFAKAKTSKLGMPHALQLKQVQVQAKLTAPQSDSSSTSSPPSPTPPTPRSPSQRHA